MRESQDTDPDLALQNHKLLSKSHYLEEKVANRVQRHDCQKNILNVANEVFDLPFKITPSEMWLELELQELKRESDIKRDENERNTNRWNNKK
jgi:hypothetical protein